ncbi:MAG TPA: hypothetical protein VN679_10400 [Candidatus Acidoferrales bacterium]|nr:hypothetical protein [Candidatus Acidoferrales bacterium]
MEQSAQAQIQELSLVPASMLSFMEREKLEGEWGDVAKIIREHAQGCPSDSPLGAPLDRRTLGSWMGIPVATQMTISMSTLRPPVMDGRPLYGEPIKHPAMANAPTNEMGVCWKHGWTGSPLEVIELSRLFGA